MRPAEYIAELKREKPPKVWSQENLPERLVSQWHASGKSIEELLASLNTKDYAAYLLSHLNPRLPAGLHELFDHGFIAVGESNDPTPNAYTVKIDDEGFAIVFNSGLRDFLYRVARILATRFFPIPKEGEHKAQAPRLVETARLITEVFWWFEVTEGHAFGPDYPIDSNQIQIANLLATEAEAFLLAHEIGHVIDLGGEHADEYFAKLSLDLSLIHREEHAADAIGLVIAMELYNESAGRDAFRTPLVYAGVEFALQVYRVLELLSSIVPDKHPPASSRLEFIRSEMKACCVSVDTWTQLTVFSAGIEVLFEEIARILVSPGEHNRFFQHQANRVVEEINDLLEACTGGPVPDYFRFYLEAGKIFERGYSHILLEWIAHVSSEFFTLVESPPDGPSANDQKTWISFQKYKLLLGYVTQHMNEPARSIFLQAFGTQRHAS